MKKNKYSLKKSLLRICAVTFSVLCIGLMLLNYVSYRRMLYRQYKDHMKNVLTNTACEIDTDDLAACIRTGVESPKYAELQQELDMRKDNTDLHFLYIVIPLNTEPEDNIQNVIAAMSAQEYEETPEQKVKLNSLTGDSYSPEVAGKYLEAYESGELSYFRNRTEWGDDYTALLPLFDSQGSKIAALCVDIEMSEITGQLLYHSLLTIAVTAVAGVVISILFLKWAKKNVVLPIEKISNRLNDYTARGMNLNDPESLIIEMPDFHAGSEIEELAEDIVFMSETLCVTVQSMNLTQQELAHLSIIATKDELTHVGNKAAYADYVECLQQSVDSFEADFAVVLADINRLKFVNDSFGHEKGDAYIRACCLILCDVYGHSPVFRIGGDEFVVFLTGQDYEKRNTLFQTAKERFERAQDAPGAMPWEMPSMALGMAIYSPDFDMTVQQVVARADRKMYEDKAKCHKRALEQEETRSVREEPIPNEE